MLVFEKEYFTFNDLEKRWGATRKDLDLLILELKLRPSYFVQRHMAEGLVFDDDDVFFGGEVIDAIVNDERSGYSVKCQFYYLREPCRVSLSEYCFYLGCSDPIAIKKANEVDYWCKFNPPIRSDNKDIVFLNAQVLNFEKECARRESDRLAFEQDMAPILKRMADQKMSKAKDNSVKCVTNIDDVSETVLHNTHLMKLAIEVQKTYWPTFNAKPIQKRIVPEIMEKYSISKPAAQAVERVACPRNRKP